MFLSTHEFPLANCRSWLRDGQFLAERKTKYQQCSGAVINALANISAHINPDPDLQMDFLLKLMEMYVTIGLEVKRKLQADREPANRYT